MSSRTRRSSAFAPARANATGSPCRVQSRCSRSPQNQRECEAQYPYCAHPASSERLTVSRERAHSTGVESTTQTSPDHRLVLAARTRVQCRTRPAGRPQPLVVPGLLRQVREQVPQVRAGVPDPAGLRGKPQQRLHDCQGHQLSIAELRRQSDGRPQWRELRGCLQQVIGSHVQCGSEGVYFCRHKQILGALALSPQASLGLTRLGDLDTRKRRRVVPAPIPDVGLVEDEGRRAVGSR